MSRIGKMPITLPKGVTVEMQDHTVTVKGPKGTLTREFHPDIQITLDNDTLAVTRTSDHRDHRALHGLTRALLANMVQGVSAGFKRDLVIEGTGYRADVQGTTLVLNVGYSHPVHIRPATPETTFQVDKTGKSLSIIGIDKEVVGETAAIIRRHRPPEPYKGKGIRYSDEVVRRKPGKSGKVG